MFKLGIDVGSTTLKCAVLDDSGALLWSRYLRHYSRIAENLGNLLHELGEQFPGEKMELALSGSAGMGLAEELGVPFVQEVYAERIAVKKLVPGTDVGGERGGEES